MSSGDHRVSLFSAGDGSLVARVGGERGAAPGLLSCPYGVRLTADGAHVAVADFYNDRVSLFSLRDGAFVRHVATEAQGVTLPRDMVRCRGRFDGQGRLMGEGV
jgi:hypothetical protein